MGDMAGCKKLASTLVKTKYSLYVLFLMMLAYLINQFKTFSLIATNASMAQEIQYGDRRCDVRAEMKENLTNYLFNNWINETAQQYCTKNEYLCTEEESEHSRCYWHYLGRGTDYQLLAGPIFIVLFSISGIPLGLVSELHNINRKVCLVMCMVLWSVMTILGGFSTSYWHLALSRLLMGVFSAGCVPFCSSILADYFQRKHRGAALGFFNWGVFVGYSLTFLLIIVERDLGWRAVYVISGLPGILLGIVVGVTVREPQRRREREQDKALSTSFELSGMVGKLRAALRAFADPVLLLLCVAGAVRNGAGLVWAYNILLFFNEYWPGTNVEFYMSWIPLVFGSTAVFGGGYLSDRLASKRGVKGRLLVLIFCCMSSAPFQAALLWLPPPWCFGSHVIGILLGEMWLGVCATIVIELSPSHLTTSCVGLYIFIIQIIGGNMNLLVTPITETLTLRLALLITFPGFYIVGGAGFVVTLILYSALRANEIRDEGDGKISAGEALTPLKGESGAVCTPDDVKDGVKGEEKCLQL